MNWILLLMIVLATTRSAPTNPAASPINPPVIPPVNPLISKPMSPDFSLLLSRSMFVRGHQAIDTHRPGVVQMPSTMPAAPPSTASSLASRPEDTLIFNGVTVSNGVPMAFIEDTGNQSVQTVQVGESISSSHGKIAAITLDSLTYTNAEHTVKLHIGQNLSGTDASPPSEMPTAATPPDGTSPTPGGALSIIDQMRHKRQQELLGH